MVRTLPGKHPDNYYQPKLKEVGKELELQEKEAVRQGASDA